MSAVTRPSRRESAESHRRLTGPNSMGHGMHGTVPPSLTASAGRRSLFGRLALARTARTNVLCPECRTGPLIFSSRSAPPASFRVIPSIVHRGAIRVVPRVVCLEPCVGADCRGSRRVTGCTRWSGRAARLFVALLVARHCHNEPAGRRLGRKARPSSSG